MSSDGLMASSIYCSDSYVKVAFNLFLTPDDEEKEKSEELRS
jgi:hypothetical protein